MNRILLGALIVWICFSGCGKVNTDIEQAQVQLAIDTGIIGNYVRNNHLSAVAKKDRTTGEYYIIDTLGTGSALFTSSTLVTVGYSGKVLGRDTNFVKTANFHPSFTLGEVIKGWQIGIPLIKKGGTIRLLVPSGYAYGPYAQSNYNLPPNAILDFTIKLYDITN